MSKNFTSVELANEEMTVIHTNGEAVDLPVRVLNKFKATAYDAGTSVDDVINVMLKKYLDSHPDLAADGGVNKGEHEEAGRDGAAPTTSPLH